MQGAIEVTSGGFGLTSMPASESGFSFFDNPEFGPVRVVRGDDGEPWFVASDVAKALGYEKPNNAVNEHCKKINKFSYPNSGQLQPYNTIPESDVYRLIMRSNLPSAELFQDWVVEDILPSLRRSGFFGIPNFKDPIAAAEAWLDAEKARVAAEKLARIEGERADHYKKTKAEIGNRREATAMATASVAVRKVSALENRIGEGQHYKQVKAIPWLLNEFEESRSMFQQVGKKLKSMSDRIGRNIIKIPSSEYPDGVKAYHIEVIDAFRVALETDLNMLAKYRKR